MQIIEDVRKMQKASRRMRATGQRIGFVPTMGYLHAGHLSLMRLARGRADVVVVSIFVNPIQFGAGEDFSRYPRDNERDTRLCAEEGVDILFRPAVGQMYEEGHSVFVDERRLSQGLCGASRPGHFQGVVTVVAKLFNIVQPDVAVFGQKDAQQARIIRQLVKDLNFQVEVVVGATVREPDGLAMSSRNQYLSGSARQEAVCLVESLRLAVGLYRTGVRDAAALQQAVIERIGRTASATVDYVAIVDRDSLAPVETVTDDTLIALAVKIGETRLIDNAVIGSGV
jgi:pantoate--beta-alanine ligase